MTFFKPLAEIQFESGYPYIMFEDTVNRANPIAGRINMSNLCSEILQVNSASRYDDNLDYTHIGHDISCNLGSLNIAHVMDSPDIGRTRRNRYSRPDGGVGHEPYTQRALNSRR
ncbi:ribonucleoside-diphosphate reductase 2 subunit alpha [Salmonella enterica subsp. enterica]|uniref:Ribonucleoside-diphosphate reductase 2 subunit alpha n=1 Tax=Salmonella enterica I TaxID=59201 RepID=A0A447N566_SALET|nr:ribonucleoside-diphosphate reductase 2 subunit alpha [Salmonella enterica subsp. enterica]